MRPLHPKCYLEISKNSDHILIATCEDLYKMADYINNNILSQAYIHVEPLGLDTQEKLLNFKRHIIEFARSRTDFYLAPGVQVDVEFEEGSLKARITIMGSILLLMQGISNYPSFKEGVSLLYQDSRRLAEYLVSEAQFHAGAKHQDVIRLEARTGIIGSLHKVTLQLENIKRGANGGVLARDLEVKIDKVISDIQELSQNLENSVDEGVVKFGLSGIVKEIPETPIPPKDKINNNFSISGYQDKRRRLRMLFHLSN